MKQCISQENLNKSKFCEITLRAVHRALLFLLGGKIMLIVTKEELMNLGYGKYQAEDIIRKAKAVMVSRGYSYYLNKRVGKVPVEAVESVLGIEMDSVAKEVGTLG